MMLSIRGLCAGYPERPVLTGIDLDVGRGELVALLGPNGCGKTTLLRAITGALKSSSGEVLLDGTTVSSLTGRERASRIAVVAQAAGLPERFTAFECVLMGRTPHLGLLQSEGPRDLAVVRAAMERAACWELANRHVDQLSGGERQRVIIARALAQEPDVLLLDEPTSHLDLQHQVEAFLLITQLCREQDLAALAVVHDATLAATFADRLALMSGGRIIASGRPEAVIRRDLLREVYGIDARVIEHPVTGRPIVIPETARIAAPDLAWLERIADPTNTPTAQNSSERSALPEDAAAVIARVAQPSSVSPDQP
jgi:iron complex transport system ATP-binding protein